MHRLAPVLPVALPTFGHALQAQSQETSFPVPENVSPELGAMIAAGLPDGWNTSPDTPEAWKRRIDAMKLILALHAKAGGRSLPAAPTAGTPRADMTMTGDSSFTDERVDNMLVGYNGWIAGAARLHADGHMTGRLPFFPRLRRRARLSARTSHFRHTGSFPSNTARIPLRLRQAGVPADLIIFKDLSHAQYQMNEDMPETRFHFEELGRFFERPLSREKNDAPSAAR